jgi:hypothetical protein
MREARLDDATIARFKTEFECNIHQFLGSAASRMEIVCMVIRRQPTFHPRSSSDALKNAFREAFPFIVASNFSINMNIFTRISIESPAAALSRWCT